MNPRIRALLDRVTARAREHIGAAFLGGRVHELAGDKLVLLGEPLPIGERGNAYEVRMFPAIMNAEPFPGKAPLELTFAVLTPTGELRARRDHEERDRKRGDANTAFVEMATELTPVWPEMQELIAMLVRNCDESWPDKKFECLCLATSAELDVVCVLVAIESLKRLALDVARD